LSTELLELIRSPPHRLQLYKLLRERPLAVFQQLLHALFHEEMQYRCDPPENDPWHDTDAYEGVYDCAYLLYRHGNPADVFLLWEQKWRNMDVGSSLGVEFFVGAGVEPTLQYLQQAGTQDSQEIQEYVREYFKDPDALSWQRNWEQQRDLLIQRRVNLRCESYEKANASWPRQGRHILAQFDDDSIIVYQAYRPEIADYAARHQRFGGEFSYSRMSWIKPNFLWMMYRSGWATKPGQERVLAIRLRRSFFDSLLERAVQSSFDPERFESLAAWQRQVAESDVRLQWDPDHDPAGRPVQRRALQLGLRGEALRSYGETEVLSIEDITSFVAQERPGMEDYKPALRIPQERTYMPGERGACNVGLDKSP
jgi:hypothetical protein